MRNLLGILLFIGLAVSASAQKIYFIYLQTDNGNPFYVKMNDKIYSSSTAGYLTLSNLADSVYNFSIGFPSSQSESKFTVALEGRDRGFLIKNFQSGLGLFDLQSLTIIEEAKDKTISQISYQKRNDDFASLLSKAANDTSLLYSIVIAKQDVPVQKEQTADINKPKIEDTNLKSEGNLVKDTAAVVGSSQTSVVIVPDSTGLHQNKEELLQAINQEEIKDSADTITNKHVETIKEPDTEIKDGDETKLGEEFKRSRVEKHSESSTSEGFGLVFFDTYDKGVDTIRLIIPNPKFTIKETQTDSSQSNQLLKQEELKTDEIRVDTPVQQPVVVAPNSKSPIKSNCKSNASENDFFKLRKNMAAKETDEAMVDEAKKVFKNKCFTTEQIKNLSALFLTSAGKYQFFDAAYLHVTDQERFPALESQIKDDYYLRRFKALIGE